ncbi:uncharacterized protein V6R79_022202 [Siganus canaliculatus]
MPAHPESEEGVDEPGPAELVPPESDNGLDEPVSAAHPPAVPEEEPDSASAAESVSSSRGSWGDVGFVASDSEGEADGSSPAGSVSSRSEDGVVEPGPGELGLEDDPSLSDSLSLSDSDNEWDGSLLLDVEPVLGRGDGVWVDRLRANQTPSPRMSPLLQQWDQDDQIPAQPVDIAAPPIHVPAFFPFFFPVFYPVFIPILFPVVLPIPVPQDQAPPCAFAAPQPAPDLDPSAEDGGPDVVGEEDIVSEGSSQESPGPASFPRDFARRRRRREESEEEDGEEEAAAKRPRRSDESD